MGDERIRSLYCIASWLFANATVVVKLVSAQYCLKKYFTVFNLVVLSYYCCK